MWTKMMDGPRKKAPKTIAVIDPDRCFGAFACSICQAACPVAGCIVEEPDRDGRMVCAVRADLCIGCGLCVTVGNATAPQQREFGLPAAPGAYGQPPSPPADASKVCTPKGSDARTLASAVPRVSWKCSASCATGTRARTASSTRGTCPGCATPIVSLTATSKTPSSSSFFETSATRSGATSPSYGQPNAVDR